MAINHMTIPKTQSEAMKNIRQIMQTKMKENRVSYQQIVRSIEDDKNGR
ncbi:MULTISPECIES: hypothetical protein [Bacillus]|nr:hypothetical protein [Bacillus velezensis]